MDIVLAPDPKLRVKTKPVKKITPEILKVAKDMIKLTKAYIDPEGIGLATTQVGRDENFFIGKIGQKFVTFFNPQILSYSKKTKTFFEGCLSIPNYYAEIERPVAVTVAYQDATGKQIKTHLTGMSAWIFQHETDHLKGKLFMDQVVAQKGKIYKVVGKDEAGSDIFEEIKLM
ncbi:peptide deformylase [Patescibacteria group bacterium]|nr:peptide deformylase [Patescibacteria group bacterium]MCL5409459.1 peptide deformylase [Patescibacteria group bacterium]